MDDHDRLDIDQLDRIWDRIATGERQLAAEEDSMTDTMLHLHRLHDRDATISTMHPAIDRAWTRTAPRVGSITRPTQVKPTRIAWVALGSRPVSAVATFGLIALIALSGYLAIGANQHATPIPVPTPNYRLLVADDHGMLLREIDPITLADRPAGTRLSFARAASPVADDGDGDSISWTASADGRTLVGLLQKRIETLEPFVPDPITVIVVDAATGRERRRFELETQIVAGPQISGDGTRLAVESDGGWRVDPPPTSVESFVVPRWDIYDLTTGSILSNVRAINDRDPLGAGSGWLDRTGARFYRLAVDGTAKFRDPWTIQLVAHDTATGQEVARTDLPGVIARYGPPSASADAATCAITETPTGSAPETSIGDDWQTELPAIEISPDGATMAIVNSKAEQLTVVDLGTMQITTSTALDPGVAASTPAPVVTEGPTACASAVDHAQIAAFTADGSQLIVGGFAIPTDGRVNALATDATLVRIDIASGAVAARATRPAHEVPFVLPYGAGAPDGENVYVRTYDARDADSTFQRLDAETLAVEAERSSSSLEGIGVIVVVVPSE